jgi:GDP-L-fucose synthase
MLKLSDTCSNELINIGAGEEYTIREFAATICQIVGYDEKKIEYDVSKYVGAKSKFLDTTKLQQLITDLSYTPLKQGLHETIDWFMKAKAY